MAGSRVCLGDARQLWHASPRARSCSGGDFLARVRLIGGLQERADRYPIFALPSVSVMVFPGPVSVTLISGVTSPQSANCGIV